jgi:hypothetical protein
MPKHTSPLTRGFQLRAAIKQATDLADTKLAGFEKDLASLQAEIQKDKKDAAAAKAELAKGAPTPELIATVKGFKGRQEYLRMKVEALEDARDEVLAAKTRMVELRTEAVDEEQRGVFERMRGLLAYGFATGQTTPDCQLLYDTLGDYLEAKTDGDRKAAHRAVDLIFAHGNLGDKRGETGGEDRIIAEFEAITDPERRTAFYNRHSTEIQRGFDARKNI